MQYEIVLKHDILLKHETLRSTNINQGEQDMEQQEMEYLNIIVCGVSELNALEWGIYSLRGTKCSTLEMTDSEESQRLQY